MGLPMGRWHFRFMSLCFGIRDIVIPPRNVVREADIEPGARVLDYGCGTGSYALAAARLVGESGKVYALDISPPAVERVERMAVRNGLANVVAIRSACATGLTRGSVDVALLYDVLHGLKNPRPVLGELHRALAPHGRLSVRDHHMAEADMMGKVTADGRFTFLGKGKRTYTFSRGEGR